MSRAKQIINELFSTNEAKYTKATFKKDVIADQIEGYISMDGDNTTSNGTFIPVKLSTRPPTVVENGTLWLGTLLMKNGDIVTESDASGKTFDLTLGSTLHVTLRKKV